MASTKRLLGQSLLIGYYVRLFDQPGLIHIDLGVQAFLKALAARIQIAAHAETSHRANIIMFIIL